MEIFLALIVLISILAKWLFQRSQIPPAYVPSKKSSSQDRSRLMLERCPVTNDAYLVIGAGFVGSKIIQALLKRGERDVTVLDASSSNAWAKDPRVKFVQADISDLDAVQKACAGKKAVLFTAAIIRFMDSLAHQFDRSYRVNVVGAENVIKACRDQKVQRLVYTSTMHVSAKKGIHRAENDPLRECEPRADATTATSHYACTKAMAEKLILDANCTTLRTIALRLGGVFGGQDSLAHSRS